MSLICPLFFWTVSPQLIPNIDVPYFSPIIFLLTTHQSAVPYHEHILLSLMCQRGLGPVPYFFQKICLASLTYCPLLNIVSVKANQNMFILWLGVWPNFTGVNHWVGSYVMEFCIIMCSIGGKEGQKWYKVKENILRPDLQYWKYPTLGCPISKSLAVSRLTLSAVLK